MGSNLITWLTGNPAGRQIGRESLSIHDHDLPSKKTKKN